MKTNQTVLATTLCTLLMGVSAQSGAATPTSWDYMSLEFVAAGDYEEGGFSEDLEGYRFEAAKGLGDFMIIRAASNAYLVEDVGVSYDLSTQQLGAGAHFPIATGPVTLDLWGTLNYERFSYVGLVGTGPGVDLGLRAQLTREFELGVTAKVLGDIDFGDGVDGDFTGYTLSAAYQIIPKLAIQGSFSNHKLEVMGEDLEHNGVVGVGVRLYY